MVFSDYVVCHHPEPTAILTHEGQFSFQNQAVFAIGEQAFIPLTEREAVFNCCRSLQSGELVTYVIQSVPSQRYRRLEVLGLEIDPRYGKVAMVRSVESGLGVSFG